MTSPRPILAKRERTGMTNDRTDEIFTYAVIIPDRTGHRILVQRDAEGWSLPGWPWAERTSWAEPGHVNRTVRERLGIDAITLRRFPPDPATAMTVRIYELETPGSAWRPPPDARWIGHSDLDRLSVTGPGDRALPTRWFAEVERGEVPPRRAPWARPGWFQEATGWIAAELKRVRSAGDRARRPGARLDDLNHSARPDGKGQALLQSLGRDLRH